MRRLGHLFVALNVAFVVLVSGSAILDGLRSADADIGAPSAYTSRGRIARNVVLGKSVFRQQVG